MENTKKTETPVKTPRNADKWHQGKDPYDTRTITPATPRCVVTIKHHPERREG